MDAFSGILYYIIYSYQILLDSRDTNNKYDTIVKVKQKSPVKGGKKNMYERRLYSTLLIAPDLDPYLDQGCCLTVLVADTLTKSFNCFTSPLSPQTLKLYSEGVATLSMVTRSHLQSIGLFALFPLNFSYRVDLHEEYRTHISPLSKVVAWCFYVSAEASCRRAAYT